MFQKKDILKRMMMYCARAEHCTQDVLKKLAELDVSEEETEEILETLRHEKYLDDDRYAHSFVSDKWKLDLWGRGKIRNGLFQKGLSDLQIQNALATIDDEQYISGMENLLSKKRETIRAEPPIHQMKKIISFGVSRGFEEELMWQWLEKEGLSFDADLSSDSEGDSF